MHDATFGVMDKVVPYLRFWAFGSVTRCAFSRTAHACVRAHFADARAMLQDGGPHRCNPRASRRRPVIAHATKRGKLQTKFGSVFCNDGDVVLAVQWLVRDESDANCARQVLVTRTPVVIVDGASCYVAQVD